MRQSLRQYFLTKRNTLSLQAQQTAAKQLAQQLSATSLFQQSHAIAFYQAVRCEMNPDPLLQHARQQGKNCYLPVLDPAFDLHLCFLPYNPEDTLILNRYKIHEPLYEPQRVIAKTSLDLVLVPLVAADHQGNRLGSGAGYYDHTFSFLLQAKRPTKPFLLGLAYDWQRIENLSAEPWDVPLDAVATESGFYFTV